MEDGSEVGEQEGWKMVRDQESDGRWFRAKEEGRDAMKQEQEGIEDGSDVGDRRWFRCRGWKMIQR
jgi:hypothetical protein